MREKLFLTLDDMYCMEECNKEIDCEDCLKKSIDKIMSLIHSEMVGLVPAEKLADNDEYSYGWNALRVKLLSAIEKKFKKGEAL